MADRNLEFALRIVAKDAASKELAAMRQGIKAMGDAARSADAQGGFSRTRAGIASISQELALARKAYLAFQSVQAVVAGARDITDRADAYNSFTARLRLAAQSAQGFQAAMEDVRRIAVATQAPVANVAQLYARLSTGLRAIGAGQAQTAAVTETVALALKISGASAAEAGSAMLQLSQAFASGVLRGEEFNAVNEAAPRLMQALADSLGVPVGQLRAMAENGELTARVLAERLPQALETLRREAEQIPNSIGGAFQQLSDAYTQYIGQTGQATGLSSGLADAVQTLANNFGLVGDAVIALSIGAAVTGLASLAVAASGAAAAAGALTFSLGGLRIALAALSASPLGAFALLATTLGAIVFGASRLSDAIKGAGVTATSEADRLVEQRRQLEGRVEQLVKERAAKEKAVEKEAAEARKKAQVDAAEASIKSWEKMIEVVRRERDEALKSADELARKASDLRARAAQKPKDDSDSGQASAGLDLTIAQMKLQRLKDDQAAPLEDVQRQAELVRQMAGNINDATRAQQAKAAADLAEADALERAAKAQKQTAAEAKGELDNLQTTLAQAKAALKELTHDPKVVKLKAETVQIDAEIATLKAQLAELAKGVTIPINSQANTGGATGKFATGGLITGPGHDTSDNLLAWLSPGEFVLRAAAVRRYGAGLLAAMNNMSLPQRAVASLPRFAAGGMVGAAPSFPHLGRIDLGLGGRTYPVYVEPDVAGALSRASLQRGGRL